MDTHATARRQAQRFLADHVRNDWEWPDVPSTNPDQLHDITEWRERSYAATSSEPETDAEKPFKNPYKFDSPDSVADTLETKKDERRRKRRRKEQEEASWNEGLMCFVQRRDAWTGVEQVSKLDAPQHSHQAADKEHTSEDTEMETGEASHEATPLSPPENDSAPFCTPPVESESSSAPDKDILVPVAAPLLPTSNPLRAAITPKSYTEIFNKVVINSRTPSVPINLSDMTRALVQGWKENGEWPPRAGPLDPLIGRRKGGEIKSIRGVSGAGPHSEGSFLAHHPHVKRGVESVKKVFRLSGAQGSSHSHHGVPSGEIG